MSSLDKIRVKIERAKEHIQNFDSAKRIFLESNPYVVASRYLPDFGEQGQTVYHLAKAVAIPERLSLIAGDAIHNLRCALDYLAYQLADLPEVSMKTRFSFRSLMDFITTKPGFAET
jgi:hypothetical protein